MRANLVIVIVALFAVCGCASPMKLSARGWDVPRADGSPIRAFVVTDTSLPAESYDAVALCVVSANVDPLDRLENIAGACAAGCELLLVAQSTSDESRVDDHLMVLRRFLDQRGKPARAVIIIGVHDGDEVASTIANREPRVTHVALLAPTHSRPDVSQPTFIAELGNLFIEPPRPNETVRCYPLADDDWREIGSGRTIRPLIEMDLIHWLTKTGALTNDRANALSARVRQAHREWYGGDRQDYD